MISFRDISCVWRNRTTFPHQLACRHIVHCAVDEWSLRGASVPLVQDRVTIFAKRFVSAVRTIFVCDDARTRHVPDEDEIADMQICMFGSILPDSIVRAEIPSRCTDMTANSIATTAARLQ
jgi:hypothetical protein